MIRQIYYPLCYQRFFSFALPIIIFVVLINLITKFIRRKLYHKSYTKFNKRNIADTFSTKEIAKKFGKNAKDVNEVLLNLGFIKKMTTATT